MRKLIKPVDFLNLDYYRRHLLITFVEQYTSHYNEVAEVEQYDGMVRIKIWLTDADGNRFYDPEFPDQAMAREIYIPQAQLPADLLT
jgi:hypothetical protein